MCLCVFCSTQNAVYMTCSRVIGKNISRCKCLHLYTSQPTLSILPSHSPCKLYILHYGLRTGKCRAKSSKNTFAQFAISASERIQAQQCHSFAISVHIVHTCIYNSIYIILYHNNHKNDRYTCDTLHGCGANSRRTRRQRRRRRRRSRRRFIPNDNAVIKRRKNDSRRCCCFCALIAASVFEYIRYIVCVFLCVFFRHIKVEAQRFHLSESSWRDFELYDMYTLSL